MDPIIGASLISAGTSLAGGALDFGQSDDIAKRNSREAQLDRAHQRQFAQHGIQWRVNDARAAGVHPLVALGAQLNQGTPTAIGTGNTGSAKGDAIRAAGAAIAESLARRDKEKAETRLLNAQADFTEQQAADSQLARMNQMQVNDVVVPEFHEVNDPQYTPRLNIGGIPIRTAPTTDAQTLEDRYGEFGGSALGLLNAPADLLYSLKVLVEELGSRFRAPRFDKPQFIK